VRKIKWNHPDLQRPGWRVAKVVSQAKQPYLGEKSRRIKRRIYRSQLKAAVLGKELWEVDPDADEILKLTDFPNPRDHAEQRTWLKDLLAMKRRLAREGVPLPIE